MPITISTEKPIITIRYAVIFMSEGTQTIHLFEKEEDQKRFYDTVTEKEPLTTLKRWKPKIVGRTLVS